MKDLIDRQAAISALGEEPEVWTDSDAEIAERNQWRMDVAAIRAVPSAEPERKRGQWLELTNTNHTYVCSVCGRMLVNITDGKNTVTKNYPYCHCGADMKGEQDETNVIT